jgi:hypothetical protein
MIIIVIGIHGGIIPDGDYMLVFIPGIHGIIIILIIDGGITTIITLHGIGRAIIMDMGMDM